MYRRLLSACVLLLCANTIGAAVAQEFPAGAIGQATARKHSLVQAWAARIRLDPSRDRVTQIVLDQGLLLVSTDAAVLQALDAETGRTLWTIRVGNSRYVSLPAATNGEMVAITNGSTMYVIDRKDGRVLWDQRLSGAPSAGVALSDKRVYVPMTGGTLEGFLVGRERSDEAPAVSRGAGSIDVPPLVTAEAVAWASSEGIVYSGRPDTLALNFRLKTQAAIVAPLGYSPPNIIAASRDGYVYAVHEKKGETAWQFSSARSIVHQPVVIGHDIYVIPESGGMHCITADEGVEQWFAPGIMQFVAASDTRLYATDQVGRLLILDRKTGRRIDSLATELLPLQYVNVQTDRIYLGTTTGLVECLHELPLSKPLMHVKPPAPKVPPPIAGATPEAPAAKPGDASSLPPAKQPPPTQPRPSAPEAPDEAADAKDANPPQQ